MKNQTKPKKLSKEQKESTQKHSVSDGSAHQVMMGFGEQYVVPYGIKLGGTDSQIAVLSSFPYFIGSLFQLVGAKLTNHFKDRKKVVTFFVFFQALSYLPLFILPLITKNILLLTVLFSIYLALANLSVPAWSSWIGDFVDENERAKFFSHRNKITIIYLVISVITAGLILNYLTDVNIWIGFGILFTIAMIGKMTSWYHLLKHDEPIYTPDKSKHESFLSFVRGMHKHNFGNFVLFRFIFTIGVFIGAPFMPILMLKYLHFSFFEYMVIIVSNMLTKVLAMRYWGRYSEKYGTRNIMYVSIFLISIFPIGYFAASYFTAQKMIAFGILFVTEVISGFGWGGFELTSFNYMLETSKREQRANYFAFFNVFWGLGLIIGGIIGAWLVYTFPFEKIGFEIVFATFLFTAILRLTAALIFRSRIKEVKMEKEVSESRLFFDIAIANPIEAALDNTYSAVSLAGTKISTIRRKIKHHTKKAVKKIKNRIIP